MNRRATYLTFFLTTVLLLSILWVSAVQANEPGWRQMSQGLDGGTVTDMEISPGFATDKVMFAVTETDTEYSGGGLFRATNGRWTQLYSALKDTRVRDVVLSPNFSADQTLFAATKGSGLFQSTDMGTTWQSLGLTNVSFWTIEASPNYETDQLLYVGGHKALYRVRNDGADAQNIGAGLVATDTVRSLAFSPSFSQDGWLYAGTTSLGIARTNDGGQTWQMRGLADKGPINILTFGVDGQGNKILFAGTEKLGVFKSSDGGAHWEEINSGLGNTKVRALRVSPQFATDNTIFVGLASSGFTNNGLYRSTNGGASWTRMSDALVNVGVRSIVLAPDYAQSKDLYVGLMAKLGVAFSANGGSVWQQQNAGLAALSVDELVIWSNFADRTVLVAAAKHAGLFLSDDNGADWQSIYGNLPSSRALQKIAVSPDFGNDQTIFSAIQYRGIWRTEDGGQVWSLVSADLPGIQKNLEIKAMTLSPDFRQDDTLYLGTTRYGVFRSTDRGLSWQEINNGLPISNGDTVDTNIRGLVTSPHYVADKVLFAATDQGVYKRVDDGQGSWQYLSGGFPGLDFYQVAPAPNYQENTANATVFASASASLLRSTDGGSQWQEVEIGLPANAQVQEIVFSPRYGLAMDGVVDTTIFIGLRDGGVYVSDNGGDSWHSISNGQTSETSQGLKNTEVRSLVISQGLRPKLYAGTAGSGIWQYNIDLPSPNLSCGDAVSGDVTLDGDLVCTQTALVVTAPSTTIDCAGHAIRGTDTARLAGIGIQISASVGITVQNCIVENFQTGILLSGARESTIVYNEIAGNGTGIAAHSTGAQSARTNLISGNSFATNQIGVLLEAGADDTTVNGNTLRSNVVADIKIDGAVQNRIAGNRMTGSGQHGVSVVNSGQITGTANTITGRNVGLHVSSDNSLFSGNSIYGNSVGVQVEGTSSGNIVYNNVFSNTVNAEVAVGVGANQWSIPPARLNIIGGLQLGGNFWGKADGTGFSQICTDADGGAPDGFCDDVYAIAPNNVDQRPLTASNANPACGGRPAWSIIVYLNGDNDLDAWTGELFNRLEQAAAQPCLQIVVLWDRSGSGDTNIYLVQPDQRPSVLATYRENDTLWPQGELDMGNPQTLINFVGWARDRFPAQYELLSLVGHGNGWSPSSTATPRRYGFTGVSFDDSGGTTYLSTRSLSSALGVITEDGATPLDLLYFDACLMGMVENLYPIRNYTDFVVASENESFTSYPYDRYLAGVNASTTPMFLAKKIVEEHHLSLPGYPRTLAAYDLGRMEASSSALDALARSLLDPNDQIPIAFQGPLQNVFANVQKLDSNVDLLVDEKDGYVDLHHFAQLILDSPISDSQVRGAAQALQIALIDSAAPLIIANRAESGSYAGIEWRLENAHGVSVYLPLGEPDWRQDFYNAAELSFAADTAWDEFVRAMLTLYEFGADERPTEVDINNRPGPLEVSISKLYLPWVVR